MITSALLAFFAGLGSTVCQLVTLPTMPLEYVSQGIYWVIHYVEPQVGFFIDLQYVFPILGAISSWYFYVFTWNIIRFFLGKS